MGLFDRFKKKVPPENHQSEDILTFDHYPFKLAIIQQLMYEKNLLGEKYRGGDEYFAAYPDYVEVSDEVSLQRLQLCIDAGNRYFQDLPIPRSLAEQITYLYVGVESDVYYHINPQYLDFDDYFEDGKDFDITDISERELKQFPRLRAITFNVCHDPPEALVQKLTRLGIEVNPQD